MILKEKHNCLLIDMSWFCFVKWMMSNIWRKWWKKYFWRKGNNFTIITPGPQKKEISLNRLELFPVSWPFVLSLSLVCIPMKWDSCPLLTPIKTFHSLILFMHWYFSLTDTFPPLILFIHWFFSCTDTFHPLMLFSNWYFSPTNTLSTLILFTRWFYSLTDTYPHWFFSPTNTFPLILFIHWLFWPTYLSPY